MVFLLSAHTIPDYQLLYSVRKTKQHNETKRADGSRHIIIEQSRVNMMTHYSYARVEIGVGYGWEASASNVFETHTFYHLSMPVLFLFPLFLFFFFFSIISYLSWLDGWCLIYSFCLSRSICCPGCSWRFILLALLGIRRCRTK